MKHAPYDAQLSALWDFPRKHGAAPGPVFSEGLSGRDRDGRGESGVTAVLCSWQGRRGALCPLAARCDVATRLAEVACPGITLALTIALCRQKRAGWLASRVTVRVFGRSTMNTATAQMNTALPCQVVSFTLDSEEIEVLLQFQFRFIKRIGLDLSGTKFV